MMDFVEERKHGTPLLREDQGEDPETKALLAAISFLGDPELKRSEQITAANFIRDKSPSVRLVLSGEILYQIAVNPDFKVVVPLMEALPSMMGSEIGLSAAVPALVFRLQDKSLNIREAAAATLGKLGDDAFGSFAVFAFLESQPSERNLTRIFEANLAKSIGKVYSIWSQVSAHFEYAKQERERQQEVGAIYHFFTQRQPQALDLVVDILCSKGKVELNRSLGSLGLLHQDFTYNPQASALFATTLAYVAADLKRTPLSDLATWESFLTCCIKSNPGFGLEYPLSGLKHLPTTLELELYREHATIALSDETLCKDRALRRILSKLSDRESYSMAANSLVKLFPNLSDDQREQVIAAFFKEMGDRALRAPSDTKPIIFFAKKLAEIEPTDSRTSSKINQQFERLPSLAEFRQHSSAATGSFDSFTLPSFTLLTRGNPKPNQ